MKNLTKTLIASAAGVLLLAGGGVAVAMNQPVEEPVKRTEVSVVEEAAPTVEPSAEPTVEPAPVVEAPAPAPAPEPAPAPAPAPNYGTPIPWIADPNPNNAEGGYWDTTQCASGAGYQAPDGNQYCAG